VRSFVRYSYVHHAVIGHKSYAIDLPTTDCPSTTAEARGSGHTARQRSGRAYGFALRPSAEYWAR